MFDVDKEIREYIEESTKSDKIDENIVENINIYNSINNIKECIEDLSVKEEGTFKLIDKYTKNNVSLVNKLSELETYSRIIDELKLNERIQKDRENKFMTSLINILDGVDWVLEKNVFIKEEANKSIKTTKKLIKKELSSMNIMSTAKVGDIYDEENHICLGYKRELGYTYNQISDVIKQGYKYKGKILRQAEVIVVNNNMEGKYEYNRH